MAAERARVEEELAEIRSQLGVLRRQLEEMQRKLEGPSLSVEEVLRRRGLSFRKWNPSDDLLLPPDLSPVKERQFYDLMKRYSFRIFLRELIARRDSPRPESPRADSWRPAPPCPSRTRGFCSPETEKEYLEFLLRWGILKEQRPRLLLARDTVRSFGGTLEWFIAQVMEREFAASSLWGVRFDHLRVGGDYDVLSSLERNLVYLEVKSSPPKHIEGSEIGSFLDRIEALRPNFAVLVVDTELRMKDKLIPLLEEQLAARAEEAVPPESPRRLFDETFAVQGRIFLTNSKPNLVSNLARLMRWWLGQGGIWGNGGPR